MKQLAILLLTIFLSCSMLFAQMAINTDGSQPNPAAGLDVKFTDKGFLPPRMTNTIMYAIASPPSGLMLYNTTLEAFAYFNGSSWKLFENVDGQSCGDFTYESKTYHTVVIGMQCWMKNNLNVGTKIDGSVNQTNDNTKEKYCYNNVEPLCLTYGGLYQWDEMMNYTTSSNNNPSGRQGICAPGWHIPSDVEWTQLTDYLGGESVAGGKMKETLATHWAYSGGTNESGFTGLPGGDRTLSGLFSNLTLMGIFWSSTEHAADFEVFTRVLQYDVNSVGRYDYDKVFGYSVRCVKD
jgi:uncharacterized protein (TIGR02145 family)